MVLGININGKTSTEKLEQTRRNLFKTPLKTQKIAVTVQTYAQSSVKQKIIVFSLVVLKSKHSWCSGVLFLFSLMLTDSWDKRSRN